MAPRPPKAVVGVLLREVSRHLQSRARDLGFRDPRTGGVAIVHRFGGALNVNVHVHALVLDGVFARATDGQLRFHPALDPTTADVAEVLAAIVPGVERILERGGVGHDEGHVGPDGFAEATPPLAGLAAASVQGVVALSDTPGARPRRLGNEPVSVEAAFAGDACHARWEAFDLHAGVRVPAGQRDRLERVCRYALRPALTDERLCVGADGQVVLRRATGPTSHNEGAVNLRLA